MAESQTEFQLFKRIGPCAIWPMTHREKWGESRDIL